MIIQRHTQSPAYWEEAFVVDEGDLEYLTSVFLEGETPLTLEDLVQLTIQRRLQQEEQALQRLLAQGILYQPKGHYAIGQELVFPALGFAVGTVVNVRPGNNPEYGPFEVIQVEFEGGKRRREFASSFPLPHRLNSEDGAPLQPGESERLSAEEIMDRFGAVVREKLAAALEAHDEFVTFANKWFLKALLPEVNIGHLNLAEAVLDVHGGGPLPTEALLADVGLPSEINHDLQVFALNQALWRDERFDEVGPAGEVLWFLRRLEPPSVVNPPRRLHYKPLAYDPRLLSPDSKQLERELDDELSSLPPAPSADDEVVITLIYPHRRAGTLPLSSRLVPIFPTARVAPRVRFTLIDGRTGKQMPGWVVRPNHYVYGLEEWYRQYEIPVGGYVRVRRGQDPGTVIVDYLGGRRRSDWIRVAAPLGNRLTFELQKRQVTSEYDDLMVIGVDDTESLDALAQRLEEQGRPLARLLADLVPELTKLNPQSTVHAKTIYSAVNLVRRCPPGPILAELSSRPAFVSVGDNYWRFDESRWDGP